MPGITCTRCLPVPFPAIMDVFVVHCVSQPAARVPMTATRGHCSWIISILVDFKSNQITFIVTSPQHKCLGEWNSYERAPESAKKIIIFTYGQYIFTDCTPYTQCTIKAYLVIIQEECPLVAVMGTQASRRLLRELVIQMFVIAMVTQVFTYGIDLNGDHVMADD